VLKWLHQEGCPWDSQTCDWAAAFGDVDILQWVHEKGCPWNERTCAAAARQGNLDVLMWLREHDCPWDGNTLKYARLSSGRENERRDVYDWAIENGCPQVYSLPVLNEDYFDENEDEG
jgi:hypothetical protein